MWLKQRYRFYYIVTDLHVKFSDSLSFKPRKNSAPKPSVKFYDVKSKIFSKKAKKASSEDLPDDDEDDS